MQSNSKFKNWNPGLSDSKSILSQYTNFPLNSQCEQKNVLSINTEKSNSPLQLGSIKHVCLSFNWVLHNSTNKETLSAV